MDLSSSSLFGQQQQPFEITANIFNTIINGLVGFQQNPFQVIPTLSFHRLRSAYQRIINQPDFTMHFVDIISGFRFFLFKNDGTVRQIITDSQVSNIYSISFVNNH